MSRSSKTNRVAAEKREHEVLFNDPEQDSLMQSKLKDNTTIVAAYCLARMSQFCCFVNDE